MSASDLDVLRQHLLELLDGGHAHPDFEAAIAGLPAELRGAKPPGLPHTPWRLARAHADRPVGHPAVQHRPRPRLARSSPPATGPMATPRPIPGRGTGASRRSGPTSGR